MDEDIVVALFAFIFFWNLVGFGIGLAEALQEDLLEFSSIAHFTPGYVLGHMIGKRRWEK